MADWFASPVERAAPARDELAIKLALAVGSPMADVRQVVQVQRVATMRAMQELTRLKARRTDGPDADLAWLLVLDALIFQAEAEVRWLDHCESRVARAAGRRPVPDPAGAATPPAGAATPPAGAAAGPDAPPPDLSEVPAAGTTRREARGERAAGAAASAPGSAAGSGRCWSWTGCPGCTAPGRPRCTRCRRCRSRCRPASWSP